MAPKHQVIHKPDPQKAKNEMPKTPHVFRRGGVFYVRKRVPSELVPVLKRKEIRVSLKTSDYRAALKQAPYVQAQLAGQFDVARRRVAPAVQQVALVRELQDSEIHRLVASWFIQEESKNETWWETEAKVLSADDLENILKGLTEDLAHYQTDRPKPNANRISMPVFDASEIVAECLKEACVELPEDSQSFVKLSSLLRRALIESTERHLGRLCGTVGVFTSLKRVPDAYFKELSAHSPKPDKPLTLAELLSAFQTHHEKHSSAGTTRTYSIPVRLLRQYFGDSCPLSAIDPQQMSGFFDLLESVPLNAHQRYPGLSLKQAIEAADKAKDQNRLGKKTLANYHRNITAIFNFGRECRMVQDNPATSRIHRDRFKFKREKKALFDLDELNRLFRAPLYTGCENDENGYAKKGPNIVRRGRFWVPLLALFQGLRCNEACQLYTEDVRQEEGVWFLWIREGIDGKEATDKRLKNSSSERRVPIHRQLEAFGFLDFVRQRRQDTREPYLFPDLPMDTKGYRSNNFSKWFARFTKKIAPNRKATFHSLRHHWRTQLRQADVSVQDSEELGGWTTGNKSSERHYSHGQTLFALKSAIDRVEYSGLDLAHLVTQRPGKEESKGYPKRFPTASKHP